MSRYITLLCIEDVVINGTVYMRKNRIVRGWAYRKDELNKVFPEYTHHFYAAFDRSTMCGLGILDEETKTFKIHPKLAGKAIVLDTSEYPDIVNDVEPYLASTRSLLGEDYVTDQLVHDLLDRPLTHSRPVHTVWRGSGIMREPFSEHPVVARVMRTLNMRIDPLPKGPREDADAVTDFLDLQLHEDIDNQQNENGGNDK